LRQTIGWAKKKFGGVFPEKLFLEQLVYFDDLKERVVNWVGEGYENEEIEEFLREEVRKVL
jgi:hypothetical protein